MSKMTISVNRNLESTQLQEVTLFQRQTSKSKKKNNFKFQSTQAQIFMNGIFFYVFFQSPNKTVPKQNNLQRHPPENLKKR
jgi:hypothetical protein